jgi:hypothetical protein
MARYAKNVAAPAMPDGDDFKRFAAHARKLVDDEVALRFGRSASDLKRLGEVLRTASARLDGSFTAPYFESAANQIDRAADMLKNANARDMIEGVQRFAKTRPLLFLGGALALGIGAGRFLRSSATPALPSGQSTPPSGRSSTRKAKQSADQNMSQNTRDAS